LAGLFWGQTGIDQVIDALGNMRVDFPGKVVVDSESANPIEKGSHQVMS
jgi:hypothetical protein